jgi:hypothetical protein
MAQPAAPPPTRGVEDAAAAAGVLRQAPVPNANFVSIQAKF